MWFEQISPFWMPENRWINTTCLSISVSYHSHAAAPSSTGACPLPKPRVWPVTLPIIHWEKSCLYDSSPPPAKITLTCTHAPLPNYRASVCLKECVSQGTSSRVMPLLCCRSTSIFAPELTEVQGKPHVFCFHRCFSYPSQILPG